MLVSVAEIEKDREERLKRAKDTLLSRGMSTAQVDKDPVAGGAPYSDQALTQAQQQQQKQSDGDGASNGGPSGVGVRTLGQLDPLVVAGVALYVGTVYVFWESFRSYFDWSESLAISFIDGLPRVSVLDLFGSVLTCQAYRATAKFPKHAVETLVACSLMQFGGTFLVGVLVLGQTPSWMHSFTAWPALAVAWWLTFFSPWDMWHGRAMRSKAVVFVAAFGRAVSASHAITSWGANKALTAHFEKATVSAGCCIFAGCLAGCGGGILADLLSLEGDNWNLQKTPRALASPSFSVQRCFGASTLYYILSDPHGYLSPDDAPFPLSLLGRLSVDHGNGPSTEAAAIVAVYVTANHLLDYFIPSYNEDPVCKALSVVLGLLGVRSTVDPSPPPPSGKKTD